MYAPLGFSLAEVRLPHKRRGFWLGAVVTRDFQAQEGNLQERIAAAKSEFDLAQRKLWNAAGRNQTDAVNSA